LKCIVEREREIARKEFVDLCERANARETLRRVKERVGGGVLEGGVVRGGVVGTALF